MVVNEITNNAVRQTMLKKDQIIKNTLAQKLGYEPSVVEIVDRVSIQSRGNVEYILLDGEDLLCFYPLRSDVGGGKVNIKLNFAVLGETI